ncbi:MAG: hypothetical protein BWX81_00594 [Spirochaetes bacterium ADurb.Bin110]|jgi:ribosomal protein L40E|nr:MAG: hypothetical protein BWX81_00594 [Spirochaetes bacterium ADurb.Bin110]HNV36000.1 zinc ribbon domain-containing protein [Rectinema sp.]
MYGYNSDPGSVIIAAIIVIAIIVGLFLLLRKVVLWYYKIDKIVEQQEKMLQALERLSPPPQWQTMQSGPALESIPKLNSIKEEPLSAKWICPKCQHENYWTAKVCAECGTKQPGIL